MQHARPGYRVCLLMLALLRAGPGRASPPAPAPAPTEPLEISPADPLVVTATTPPDETRRTGRATTSIAADELVRTTPRTVPEMLIGTPGVAVQQTSAAGGSPFVRGLVGPQVLILVNGVRLNNSLWRTGPVQYLGSVGPEAVERIEVLRGPSPTRHGNDALGGVILLHTHRPEVRDEGLELHANLAALYRSAADAKGLTTGARASTSAIGLRAGLEGAEFGLLRGGRATGLQDFSGYRQGGGDARVVYQPRPGHTLDLWYLGSRQLDAPRPDRCSRHADGTILDCQIRRAQNLDLAALSYTGTTGRFFDRVEATISLQNTLERNERQQWEQATQLTRLDELLGLGSRLQLSHPLPSIGGLVQRTTVGGEIYHDLVSSQAWRLSLRPTDGVLTGDPGEVDSTSSTVADQASYTSLGLFVEHRMILVDALSLVAGARTGGHHAAAPSSARLEHPLGRSFTAPSASLFAEYRLPIPLSLGLGLVHAYRAPNLYDLTGRDRFGGGFEFGDMTRLGPERLSGVEGIARFEFGPLEGELAGFAELLHDLIVRQPSTYQGAARFEGEPVFKRVNAGLAYLWGGELQLRVALPARCHAYATATYVLGHDVSHDEPLSRVPPPGGVIGLRSEVTNDLLLGVRGLWAWNQERLSTRDRADARIPEGGTPGYFIVGLEASYLLQDHVRINAALHNLFDTSYRVHGSGLDGPGAEAQVRFELLY